MTPLSHLLDLSVSQLSPLCYYTRRLVSNQPEGTFARLRYFLGGDAPVKPPTRHCPASG